MKKRYDKIITYFLENRIIVIPMAITALLFNGLMSFIPTLEGDAINSLVEGDFQTTLNLAVWLIALVLFVQINRFAKRYLVRVFANKISLTMRKKSLNNLLRKDISYFSKNDAGDILNRNLSDIYDVTEGIRKMTTEAFDTVVLLFGYMVAMFLLDVKITLFVGIFIVLSVVCAHVMKRFVYRSNKEDKEYLSKNKEITLTQLNNELNYRGFGVSSDYNKDYEKSVEILRKKDTKALLFKSSLEPLYSAVALFGVLFIVYIGGKNVMDGVYQIGELSAYLTIYALVAKKAAKVGKLFNAYQGFKVSWARCKGYLEEEECVEYEDKLSSFDLVLKDFSYRYGDGFQTPSITLECKKGEIIGICGRVHTGKSTILRALTGLYPYRGTATLSGVEMSRVCKNKQQVVSYCANGVSMFSDSLENNIKLGREGNIKKAIRVSQLEGDLEEIGGLNANMSHSTSNISGGQQKRVQMARALYPSVCLVLLDDPFQSVSRDMALKMAKSLKEYQDEIIVFVSNHCDILKQTSKVVYLDEEKAYVDTYSNLLKNDAFKNLMEAN